MPSSTSKKVRTSTKAKRPTKDRRLVSPALGDDNDGVIVNEVAVVPQRRSSSKKSKDYVHDTAVVKPLSIPAAKSIKAYHQSDDVLELTESEECEDDNSSATLDSDAEEAGSEAGSKVDSDEDGSDEAGSEEVGLDDAVLDNDVVVVEEVDVEPVRTRSSNGITKKRFLKDAAIFSDEDDEFPMMITPKKSRLNTSVIESKHYGDDDNRLADMGFVEHDDSLSLSPLKLGLAEHRQQIIESDVDPFITDTVLQKPIILKISKGSGKKKAIALPVEDVPTSTVSGKKKAHGLPVEEIPSSKISRKKKAVALPVDEIPMSDDGDLHPDELANIAKAMAESTRELVVRSGNTSTLSSRAGHAGDITVGVGATPSVSTNTNIARANANVIQARASIRPAGGNVVLDGDGAIPAGTSNRKTFKDMFPQPSTTPMMSNSPLYHEDLMKYCVRVLPKICEVTDSTLQDEYLAADYNSLPPLKAGSLRSWFSTKEAMALVQFTHWAEQCPDMHFDVGLAAVRFVRYKNYINPSRVSPLDVNIFYTTHDRKRSILQCNMRTAICLSPVLSRDSFLMNPTTFGLRNKFFSGHFHSQEWQRFEGFVTMVFDKLYMTAQIYNDALSFVTMGPGKADREGSSPSKAPRHPGILAAAQRTGAGSDKPKKIIANSYFKSVLDFSDEVPIYDAREYPFNFASDLEDVASVLPRIYEELPSNSFVVVAYSLGHYDKEGSANLTTNILFAILVGTEL